MMYLNGGNMFKDKVNQILAYLIGVFSNMLPFLLSLKIGEHKFTRYNGVAMPTSSFGAIAFVDVETKELVIGKSVKLAEYLASIDADTIAQGKFGKAVQKFKKFKIYYIESVDKEANDELVVVLKKILKANP